MGDFLTLSSSGEVSQGMDLMKMAKFLSQLAEDKPDAVMNVRDTMVVVNKGFGEGQVHVLRQGQTQTQPFNAIKKDVIVVVGAGSVAQIVPTTGKALTVEVTPSGATHFKYGEHTSVVAQPTGHTPQAQAVLQWLYDGDVGQSSLALAQHLYLVPHKLNNGRKLSSSVPCDAADFSRCVALLDRAPFLLNDLTKMMEVSAEWSALLTPDASGVSAWERGMESGRALLEQNHPLPPSNAGVYNRKGR